MTTTQTALSLLGAGMAQVRTGSPVRSYRLVGGRRVVTRDVGYGVTAVCAVTLDGTLGDVLGTYQRGEGCGLSVTYLDRADRVCAASASTARAAVERIARLAA